MSDLGIYIHWPFCARICPYCDFNITRARNVDEAAWAHALEADLRYWAAEVQGPVSSVYFGGGTPSLMSPHLVRRLLKAIADNFGILPGAEITLEANPTDAETGKLQEFASVGINRLSLGVQSFDDSQLAFLGRNHSGDEAMRAILEAAEIFDQLTFDMIYGLPGEGLSDWQARWTRALELPATHLSAYQLTIEPGTAFANAVRRGWWQPPDDDLSADLFDLTHALADQAGKPAYEVSNFASPGRMAHHNSLYWRGDSWIGVGPGAGGRLWRDGNREETLAERNISTYVDTASPEARFVRTVLNHTQSDTELVAGGLRWTGGLVLTKLSVEGQYELRQAAEPFVVDGWLEKEGDTLRATKRALPVIDSIVTQILRAAFSAD